MANAINRLLTPVVLAVLIAGCATTTAMRNGREAEQLQDYDRAIVEYTKVLRSQPDNREARQLLDRARVRAALDHFSRGRRLEAGGRLDEALVELQLASELNPNNQDIRDALGSVRTQQRNKVAIARDGKTGLESLIERTRNMTAQGQELPNDVRLPASLTFRDAPSRDVFTALARFANINVTFDPQFRDQPVTIDLRETTLETALQALSAATRSFYRVTGPRFITVVPDTAAKRQEYEEEIVRTFPLSNADLKETVDLLRIVIDARRLAPVTATNTIAIKDTPARVAAAGKLIAAIDKARPEVVIDVELLEIDRTRLKEYGLQIASPTTDSSTGPTGINGQADVNRQNLTLRDVRNLTQSDVILTNVPALYYRLLKQDTNTRILANPQLRTSEGMPAQARFGERVPVPVTTFSPIATGGISQQPITSFNYENIGVNIDITPRTHHDDEVSLALKLEVSSISGAGFGGLPTFGNRYVSTVIRLHDGETNLLAGLIRDDERRVLSGIIGLSDLPLVGRLFAHNRKENLETDIVLTLTPRIVRVLELSEDDLRPFRVGRDGDLTGGPGGVVPLPLPVELPPPPGMQQPAQPQPQTQPPPPAPPGGTGTAPIRPPTGTPPTPER
ncbi:MAG TPA: secretin N-terminal domain-containing protein [Vicinamibacterales bacterium]|nr:secretin N-terminal domain-containing protein [Vicinamibacterales bacterium]